MSNTKRARANKDDEEQEIYMLQNMQIDGVALVPRGANNRVFVLAKNAGEKPEMKLNPAIKADALPALRGCLDKISSAYALVSGAEEDASAEDAGEIGAVFKALSEEAGQYADRFGKKKKPPEAMGKTAGESAAAAVEGAAAEVAKAGKKISAANMRELKTAYDALGTLIASAEENAAAPPAPAATPAPVAKTIEQAVADGVAQALAAFAKAAPPAAAAAAVPAAASAPALETQTRVIDAPSGIEKGTSGARPQQNFAELFAATDFGAACTKFNFGTNN